METTDHCNFAFQSTPSVWRETDVKQFAKRGLLFQSTPSVWRETVEKNSINPIYGISIHSLRMEGDTTADAAAAIRFISIHSLRMEGDFIICLAINIFISFQSTPSVWRETYRCRVSATLCRISIHSLRMEGDSVRIQ